MRNTSQLDFYQHRTNSSKPQGHHAMTLVGFYQHRTNFSKPQEHHSKAVVGFQQHRTSISKPQRNQSEALVGDGRQHVLANTILECGETCCILKINQPDDGAG